MREPLLVEGGPAFLELVAGPGYQSSESTQDQGSRNGGDGHGKHHILGVVEEDPADLIDDLELGFGQETGVNNLEFLINFIEKNVAEGNHLLVEQDAPLQLAVAYT